MDKILITGGAGAIGFQLATALADNNEIFIADNFIRSERDSEFAKLVARAHVHEINIDLRDLSTYHLLPKQVDYVYHLCAYNGTQNFYQRPFTVLQHSTLPTIHLINRYGSCKQLKRFIYAGSSESYASSITQFNWEIPTDETVPLGIENPLNPRWSYGGSKLHGELACVAAHHELGMPFTVLRYHNIYGPRMGDKHVIPDFIERAKNGVYELHGHEDTRSFLYVSDAVEATILCAQADKANGEIIHLGSDQEIKIIDLAKEIMSIINQSDPIQLHPSPAGCVKRRSPNIAKLQQIICFNPQYSLKAGLEKTIAYYAPELIPIATDC